MASRIITAPPKTITTKGSKSKPPHPEALDHAISRMRSQGWSDDAIHGQISRWHPDWNDAEISGYMGNRPLSQPTYKGPQPTFGHSLQQTTLEDPYVTWAKTYHSQHGDFNTAAKVKQDVRKGRITQDRAVAALEAVGLKKHPDDGLGRFIEGLPGAALTLGKAAVMPAYEDIRHGPNSKQAYEAREQQKQIGIALAKGVAHPVTDAYKQATGQEPFNPFGLASDVGNVALSVVPPAKAAAIIGGGAKALQGLKAAQDAEDAARAAEAAQKAEDIRTQIKALHENPANLDASGKLTPDAQQQVRNLESQLVQHLPATPTPVEQLQHGLKGARSRYGAQKAARSEELAHRSQAVEHAFRTISDPDEAMSAAQAAMRGPLPQIDFQGMKQLNPDTLRSLKQYVNQHDGLLPFQKIRLNKSLDAAVNDGRVPTPGEMNLIEHVFGKTTAQGFASVAKSGGWGDKAINLANVPRSLMASADFSAPLRQGLVAGASHPIIWGKAWPEMLRAAKSPEGYEAAMQAIKTDPNYNLALAGGVSFTDVNQGAGLLAHEEQFASDYAAQLPGIGRVVRGSSRAYTAFLNKLRMDLFSNQVRIAQAAGRDVNDEKFLKDIGKVVNAATGRGSMYEKAEHMMPALNTMLFSPRLMLSRLNYLDPTWYVRLSGPARKEALRGLFATAGAVTGTLALASQIPGVKVGSLDPRSADFGKLRIGNTRLDIAGGFQQFVRLASELATNTSVSTTTGQKTKLGSGYGVPTRSDVIENFLGNKATPALAVGHNLVKGKDAVGQPFNLSSPGAAAHVAWSEFVPLAIQDANDIHKEKHNGVDGITAALGGWGLSATGVGVQTYDNSLPHQSLTPSEKKDIATVDSLAPHQFVKQYEQDVRIAHDMNAATTQVSKRTPEGVKRERAKLLATLDVLHQWGKLSDSDYAFYKSGDGSNLTLQEARATRRYYERDYKSILRAVQREQRKQQSAR